MRNKLIPFYRDLSEGSRGYTLFLDKQSKQVYKSYHKKENSLIYWGAFALVLALIRGIKDLYLPMSNPINILIVILLVVTSVLVGVGIYKYYYRDLQEIYLTQSMIEEYIDGSKSLFKKEVVSIVIVFLFVILFTVLFLLDYWLIWLIFALFLFSMVVLGMCGLPIGRFKLYKKGVK